MMCCLFRKLRSILYCDILYITGVRKKKIMTVTYYQITSSIKSVILHTVQGFYLAIISIHSSFYSETKHSFQAVPNNM